MKRRAAMAALLGATGCRGGPLSVAEAMPAAPDGMAMRPLGVLSLGLEPLGAEGLSGLHVAPDLTLTAIGDRGRWCQARLVLAADGAPLALEVPRSGPLRDLVGTPLPRSLAGDAECLAALPDGSWLVGFERMHRIWRYPRIDGRAEAVRAPRELSGAPSNAGLESLAVLADGRWLAIAEGQPAPGEPGARLAWIGGAGGWRALPYRPAPGHDPSDLCPLPDGGALVLERRFGWPDLFTARIARLAPPGPLPMRLEGVEAARLAPPLPSDNWEGISAFRHGGRDLVAVVSDSNGMVFQRTLLMVLALP